MYNLAIGYVEDQGIVDGYSDGTFRPDNPITRGEFSKIIIGAVIEGQLSGSCTGAGGGPSFPDVDSSNTFYSYICYVEAFGYVSGYSDGTFRPDDYITVGQASKIVANAFELVDESVISINLDHKFEPYVTALAERNALPPFMVALDYPLTRGEMAEIIFRVRNEHTQSESTNYEKLLAGNANIAESQRNARNEIRRRVVQDIQLIASDAQSNYSANPTSIYVENRTIYVYANDRLVNLHNVPTFPSIKMETVFNGCTDYTGVDNSIDNNNVEELEKSRISMFYDPTNLKICVKLEGYYNGYVVNI